MASVIAIGGLVPLTMEDLIVKWEKVVGHALFLCPRAKWIWRLIGPLVVVD